MYTGRGRRGRRGRGGGEASRWQGRSEVRLLLCDSCNAPVTLEFGVTVIYRHRPWGRPKLAPRVQIGAGGRQLLEFLHGWRGKELSESGCPGPGPALAPPNGTVDTLGQWSHQPQPCHAELCPGRCVDLRVSVSRPHPRTWGHQGTHCYHWMRSKETVSGSAHPVPGPLQVART